VSQSDLVIVSLGTSAKNVAPLGIAKAVAEVLADTESGNVKANIMGPPPIALAI